MKLKDYAAVIAKLAKKHPDLEVVYASDDEGNNFTYVNFEPAVNKVEIDGDEVTVVTVN
jgi:uncharacterized protein YpmB